MWSRGETVLLRSVYCGRVGWAFPHVLVESDEDRVALFLGPGTEGHLMGRDADGRYLERWIRGDPLQAHAWTRNRVLRLTVLAAAHSLDLFWGDATDEFRGWYVNLQAPLRKTSLGFDTTDHALDIWVEPDGSWRWKDEEDFAEAQALGVFTPDEAAAVRAEGERVIADLDRLLPTGWEAWRPDPGWRTPELPPGWDLP